ncbi:glycosyl hydrolase, family 31, partial [Teladorsagia circumcincta]
MEGKEVVTGPGPHLIYRTIGGRLDMAFFPGPTPEEVVQQYLAYIGRPFLPAYWSLGYQLSRWGYPNLDAMKTVVARTQAALIPLDVAYADIDYMERYKDFTVGPNWDGFGAYVDDLHEMGLHLILIFDPAIEADYASFQRAREQNVSFIEWADKSQVPTTLQSRYPLVADSLVSFKELIKSGVGITNQTIQIMLGNVWPDNNTAMPDFLDPTNKTLQWWISEYQLLHKKVAFDGIWIDMNEPSNFDTDVYSGQPPSDSRRLSCPITGPGSQLDNPPYQTYAVYQRPPGEHLCSKTLCMLAKTGRRTMDFYNTKNLYGMSEAKATSQALSATTGKRGAIISSLLYAAAVDGHTVIRPLFFEYPTDFVAMEIDHQFLWGSAIMVAPALEQNVTSVHVYFPADIWYSLIPDIYGQQMDIGYVDVMARLDTLTPVFARGGHVIPRQGAYLTTTQSRLKPLELLVTAAKNSSSV